MQWAQTLYNEVEFARNYSRISKGFLLFEVIEYWKFLKILLASKLECDSIEAIVHWQLQKWEYVWKCTHTSEFTFEIDQWELIAQGLSAGKYLYMFKKGNKNLFTLKRIIMGAIS